MRLRKPKNTLTEGTPPYYNKQEEPEQEESAHEEPEQEESTHEEFEQEESAWEEFEQEESAWEEFEQEESDREESEQEDPWREKRKKFLLMLCVAMTGFILLAFVIMDLIKDKDKEIRLPIDSVYALGMQYDILAEKLKHSGFHNIHCIPDASGWKKECAVMSVSVDGQSTYRNGTYYNPDVRIEITYSSEGREDVSEFLLGWKNAEYTDIVELFQNKGYSQIVIDREETSEANKENLVSKMSINGADYQNGSCFVPKDAPICITYYSLMISMEKDQASFIGHDYHGVVANLKRKGFKNIQTEAVSTGWQKENSVISISIDNKTQYSENDIYQPDTRIVIQYSAETRMEITPYLTDWKTKDYKTVRSIFHNLGFSDITVKPFHTTIEPNRNRIASMKLGGTDYSVGDCFLQRTAPIVIEYYQLKITVGRSASEYENQPYSEVVTELQEKGFTNIRLYRANDLILGWFVKEGSVASISINGNKSFGNLEAFADDDEVVIIVHTFKNKGCRDITLIAE